MKKIGELGGKSLVLSDDENMVRSHELLVDYNPNTEKIQDIRKREADRLISILDAKEDGEGEGCYPYPSLYSAVYINYTKGTIEPPYTDIEILSPNVVKIHPSAENLRILGADRDMNGTYLSYLGSSPIEVFLKTSDAYQHITICYRDDYEYYVSSVIRQIEDRFGGKISEFHRNRVHLFGPCFVTEGEIGPDIYNQVSFILDNLEPGDSIWFTPEVPK